VRTPGTHLHFGIGVDPVFEDLDVHSDFLPHGHVLLSQIDHDDAIMRMMREKVIAIDLAE
jgi:hypothetical protein